MQKNRNHIENVVLRKENSRFRSKKCLAEAGTEFMVAFREEASRKLKTSKNRAEIIKLIEQTGAISKDDLINAINQIKRENIVPHSEFKKINHTLAYVRKFL